MKALRTSRTYTYIKHKTHLARNQNLLEKRKFKRKRFRLADCDVARVDHLGDHPIRIWYGSPQQPWPKVKFATSPLLQTLQAQQSVCCRAARAREAAGSALTATQHRGVRQRLDPPRRSSLIRGGGWNRVGGWIHSGDDRHIWTTSAARSRSGDDRCRSLGDDDKDRSPYRRRPPRLYFPSNNEGDFASATETFFFSSSTEVMFQKEKNVWEIATSLLM